MVKYIFLNLLAVAAFAEDKPLNPAEPRDAIQIVDRITAHATWPGMDREQAVMLQLALQTLAKTVDEQEKAKTPKPPEAKPAVPGETPKDSAAKPATQEKKP